MTFQSKKRKANEKKEKTEKKKAKDPMYVLMSIRPEYAHAIVDGRKRVEFRKGGNTRIKRIYIYSTAPDQTVLGYADVKAVEVHKKKDAWEKYGDVGCIDKKKFSEYYRWADEAVVFVLGDVTVYDKPKQLSEFGVARPPQMYMRLKEKNIPD